MNYTESLSYLEATYSTVFKLDRSMDIKVFAIKIAPFIHLVNYWSRALGYTVFCCNDPAKRKIIINNLMDENCCEFTHVDTFYKFLLECGYVGPVENIKPNPIIEQFIRRLRGCVVDYEFNQACAILGSIEFVYHMISKEINNYFVDKLHYIPENHYTAHEILDIKHSTDLFECAGDVHNMHVYLDIGAEWIIQCLNELIECKPMFGFTYEDSNVEKHALTLCARVPQNGLMILSGGDTMFDIAGTVENLTAVDMHYGQIELVNKKIQCLNWGIYNNLLGDMDAKKYAYDELFHDINIELFINTNTLGGQYCSNDHNSIISLTFIHLVKYYDYDAEKAYRHIINNVLNCTLDAKIYTMSLVCIFNVIRFKYKYISDDYEMQS